MDEQLYDGLERLRDFVLWRRKPRKWRQQTVADRAGVSQSWVASLESGRLKGFPLGETLRKLAKGLALPGEAPGQLYGFLALLESNDFGHELMSQVADGVIAPGEAIRLSRTELGSDPPLPPPEDDMESAVWERRARAEGRDLVLSVLKRDLLPEDFQAVSRMIELLYAQRDQADGLPAEAAGLFNLHEEDRK